MSPKDANKKENKGLESTEPIKEDKEHKENKNNKKINKKSNDKKKKLLKELKKLEKMEKKLIKNDIEEIEIMNIIHNKEHDIFQKMEMKEQEIIKDLENKEKELIKDLKEKEQQFINDTEEKKRKQLALLKLLANKNKNIKITNENKILSSNDYMIELTNKTDINDINLVSAFLPKNPEENITNNNNQLTISYCGERKIIELEPNYYNRYEIVDCLNEAFESENLPIECQLNDNDHFVFKTINEFFEMHNDGNSILPSLGFNNNSYTRRIQYVGNNMLLYDNIYYLSFYNLDTRPMFKINNDTNEIIKIGTLNNNKNTDYLVIKFYHSPDNMVKNKCDFFFDNHELEVEIK